MNAIYMEYNIVRSWDVDVMVSKEAPPQIINAKK